MQGALALEEAKEPAAEGSTSGDAEKAGPKTEYEYAANDAKLVTKSVTTNEDGSVVTTTLDGIEEETTTGDKTTGTYTITTVHKDNKNTVTG